MHKDEPFAQYRKYTTKEIYAQLDSMSGLPAVDRLVLIDQLIQRKIELPAQYPSIRELMAYMTDVFLGSIEEEEGTLYSTHTILEAVREKLVRGVKTRQWYFLIDQDKQGPFNREQLNEAINNEVCHEHHYLWATGMENWVKGEELSYLFTYEAPVERSSEGEVHVEEETAPQQEEAPASVKRKGSSTLLILASVLRFIAVPAWFVLGVIMTFFDFFLTTTGWASFFTCCLISMGQLTAGIGVAQAKKWGMNVSIMTSCAAVFFILFKFGELTFNPLLIFIALYEAFTLGMVLARMKNLS